MEQQKPRSYFATLGGLELRTWESNGRYPWSVTNSKTGVEIAHGEVVHLDDAMVGAAQAAGAEWGALRWRPCEEEEEED